MPGPLLFPDFVIPDEEEARKAAMVRLVADSVPEFKGCTVDDCVVSVLSGGITNQLCRVKHAETKFSVVARVFGKETERLISRAAEQFWQEAFLRTYARCANGLVYEFLEGYVALEPSDCEAHRDQIASELARLHTSAAARALFHVPFGTQADFAQVALTDWVASGTSEEALKRILERGHSVTAHYGDLDAFQGHAAELLRRIRAVAGVVPVVPCHNDLLSLNIMLSRETGAVRFIDFEYMRRNFYLADLANHFCEYAGFECEWDKLPSVEYQRAFLAKYLETAMADAPADEVAAALERGMQLLPLFALLAHYVWAAWALVQGAFSVIDFDYVSFGGKRYQRFLETYPAAYAAAEAVAAPK